MAELADAPDLGSGVYDVQVQVLLSAYANTRVFVFYNQTNTLVFFIIDLLNTFLFLSHSDFSF